MYMPDLLPSERSVFEKFEHTILLKQSTLIVYLRKIDNLLF
jgi:hypothetical protein